MGCIHKHEIIKSEISQPLSKEDNSKQSIKEEIIPKMNSLKISNNNNNKSNNLFYVNSNNSGSNVTSNNKINNYQSKDNTISSLISNDYFNNKYNLIGELSNQQNTEEFKIQLKSNPGIFRCMRKIKKISSKKQNIDIEDNSVFEEVNILKEINHKHICQLYECITTPNDYFLIMDYCKEGNLENKLKWSIKYSENQVKYLAFQLFEAVQYLNKNNYMHTDIKPINILIDEIIKNDNDEDLFNIKLLNFGSYGEIENYNNSNSLPYYIAPEVIDNKYDITTDVWSIGVIIYQMFYGEMPFGGDNISEIYSNIKTGNIVHNSTASSDLKDLLDLIFVKDYKKRIKVNECLEHKWFSAGNKIPRNTDVFKNCIIEEINTDIKNLKIEEKSIQKSENIENNSSINQLAMKNIINEDNNNKKRISNKNNIKLIKLSMFNNKRPNRNLLSDINKNKTNYKIPPLIKYIIIYIKYYIRIYYQQDKEIKKLNNIYLKYKIENNFRLFINYINNTKKISFNLFNKNLLDKNLSNNIKEQINNKEELFKLLIQYKKNFIEMNLKNSFGKLKKSTVEEIKNIFKEGNNINLYEIQKYKIYFNEIEYEMEKNKYKQIYLYMDFYKLLINSINKLYAQFISNNLSTNVDSNYTNNTMFGLNNKSKESIKNDNSKENSDKIIFEQNKDEGEKILPIDIIKYPEKNKEIENNNIIDSQNNSKIINITNDIKNKDIKTDNVNNNNINNININNSNIINKKKEKVDNNLNNSKINIIKNNINELKKEPNNKNNNDNDNYINKNNEITIEYDDEDDDYETEERKKDKNRFDPEKFLSAIGYS